MCRANLKEAALRTFGSDNVDNHPTTTVADGELEFSFQSQDNTAG